MKHIYILTLFLTFVLPGFADEENSKPKSDANIMGHVINKETKEHIPFLSVFLKDTHIGTYTDETGHYFH